MTVEIKNRFNGAVIASGESLRPLAIEKKADLRYANLRQGVNG